MKKIILRLLTYIAILYMVDSLIHGFEFNSFGIVLILATLFSITFLIVNPVVKFLTLPINQLTLGGFNFVIICLYLYFFDLIIPGLKISKGYISSISSDLAQVPTINLSKLGVVVIASLILTLLNSLVSWTQDKGKEK